MKDHKVIATYNTLALLDRSATGAPEPYVIAYHYDPLTGPAASTSKTARKPPSLS